MRIVSFILTAVLLTAPATAQQPTEVSDSLRIIQLAAERDSVERLITTSRARHEALTLARSALPPDDANTAGRATLSASIDSVQRVMTQLEGTRSTINATMAQLTAREADRIRADMLRVNDKVAQELLAARLQLVLADSIRRVREVFVGEKTKFVANVGNWMALGSIISSVSHTAKSLLLFPESQPTWIQRLKGPLNFVSLAASLGGAYLSSQGNSKVGTPTLTGGLLVSNLLQRAVTRDTVLRDLAARVARNRAFTDDVNSLARLTPDFATNAALLNNSLGALHADSLPTIDQLNQYHRLLSQQRDLILVVNQIRAKAQLFRTEYKDVILPTTREELEKLETEAARAVQTWREYETVYMQPYEYLIRRRRGF